MAGTIVRLVGGPCDGEDKTLTASQLNAGQLTCQGTLYIRSDAFTGQELIVFATSEAIGKAIGTNAPAHVTVAWTRWMRALGHKGPRAHNRVQKSTAKIRRLTKQR